MLDSNACKYIVAANAPVSEYNGVFSSVYVDQKGVERVTYSGYLYGSGGQDLTVNDYLAAKKRLKPELQLVVIDDDGLELRHQAYMDHAKREQKEISQDDWFWKLECLPPCQWKTVQGVELFHMSERICFNLVSWLGRVGDRYFELVDLATTPTIEIAQRFRALSEVETNNDIVH